MAKRKTTVTKNDNPTRGENIWRAGFIRVLSKYGNVTKAAEAVGKNRAYVYHVRTADKAFADQWDAALLDAADNIEFEALRRAKRGTLKPIYYKGQRVGYDREYSDTLMGMMLKGHKPDKYGDKLTLKIGPEDISILKRQETSASDVWEVFMQCAAEADKSGMKILDVIRAVIDEMKVEQT